MITFGVVVGCLAAYAAVGTAVGIKAYWVYLDGKIDREKDVWEYTTRSRRDDAAIGASLTAIGWPIGLFVLIAIILVHRGATRMKELAAMNAEREALLRQARKELDG